MNDQSLEPLRALLSRTFEFYRGHLRLVLITTLPVVMFVEIVLGLGLGELTAGAHKKLPIADDYIDIVADQCVVLPLVTAIIARAVVLSLRDGVAPTARQAVEEGLELFVPAMLVVIVFSVGVAVGFLLLTIPGIYLLVSWYFVVPAVAIDRARGFGAIATSAALVRGRWWHTAAVVLCLVLLQDAAEVGLTAAGAALADAANSYLLIIVGTIVYITVTLPYAAIAATLYYLDLRRLAGFPPAR